MHWDYSLGPQRTKFQFTASHFFKYKRGSDEMVPGEAFCTVMSLVSETVLDSYTENDLFVFFFFNQGSIQ